MLDFSGRVAIVTGAGSDESGVGIGVAIARLLARLDADRWSCRGSAMGLHE